MTSQKKRVRHQILPKIDPFLLRAFFLPILANRACGCLISHIMARKRKPKPKTDNRNGQALTATTEPDTTPTKATTSSSTKLKSGSSSSSSAAAVSTSSNNFIDDLLPAEPGMKHLSTVRVFVVGATLLLIGTAGFYHLPGMMQSKQDGDDEDGDDSHRLVNAFYCATMTLTT